MTDETTLTAVDERGARAGTARVAGIARRPVPAFDPDLVRIGVDDRSGIRSRPGGRRVLALAGAAAAIVVLVAAAIVLASGGEDDSAPTDEVDTGLRPEAYVIDRAPEGLGLVQLHEPPPPGEMLAHVEPPSAGDPTGPAVLYGGEDGAPGLAAVALRHEGTQVDTGEPGPDTPPEAAGLQLVDVGGGRRAWAAPETDEGPLRLVVEVEDGIAGLYRSRTSATTDPEGAPTDDPRFDPVLRDAARVVEVDGDRATVAPSGRPRGWVEQGQVDAEHVVPSEGPRVLGLLAMDGAWVTSHGVGSGEDAPEPDAEPQPVVAVTVTVVAGGALDVRARQFAAPTYDEVEVRGHPAVLVEITHRGERPWTELSVTWLEAPGVLVDVFGTNIEGDDLLALAERVRPATAAEVDDARARDLDQQLAEAAEDGVVLGRGRFSDDRVWGLVAFGGEDVTESAHLVAPGPGGSWGCAAADGPEVGEPDAPAFGETCRGRTGELAAGYGRVRTDVAEVALVDLDAEGGSTEVDRVAVLAAEGMAGFVVELPVPDHRYRVVAHDGDGVEVGSARIGA